MSMVLEVPPALSTELEEQAQRIGLSPQEHATRLLRLATKVGDSPADRLADLDAVLARVEETIAEVTPAERERIRSVAEWLRHLIVGSVSTRPAQPANGSRRRPSALGKYRGRIAEGSASYFARRQLLCGARPASCG